ncbi:MAG: carboxypeptidase-like regulatory domain-containing protein, partial [Stenotrophobium sp.]
MFTLNPLARALRLPSLLLLSAASGLIPHTALAVEDAGFALASNEGAVEGHVRDSAGTPFAGAEVRLYDSAGQIAGTTAADANGHFHFHHLKPGAYRLRLSRSGFIDTGADIVVTPGRESHTDLQLLARLATVTVTAERLERARNALSPSTGSSQ